MSKRRSVHFRTVRFRTVGGLFVGTALACKIIEPAQPSSAPRYQLAMAGKSKSMATESSFTSF